MVKTGAVLLRSETMTGREVEENVGRLADEQIAVSENRWGERRGVVTVSGVGGIDLHGDVLSGCAGVDDGCVLVFDSSFLEDEADEFTSSWDAGPVDELVCGGGHCGGGMCGCGRVMSAKPIDV